MVGRPAAASLMTVLALASLLGVAPSADADGVPDLDGVVVAGEYAHNRSFSGGDYLLYWQVDGDEVYLAMVGRTEGAVALGIEPEGAMLNADMIIGWVTSQGEPVVEDCFSQGTYGPHPPDDDQGGTDDLEKVAGTEEDGVTTIEVRRDLVTGDAKDKDVPANGTLSIIWALSNADDLTTQHAKRGTGSIRTGEGPGPGPGPGPSDDIDGVVSAGEYPLSTSFADGHFELFWEFRGDTVKVAMRARARGYVALGIEPTERMKDADMIIGWRDASGDFEVHDTWSVGETGPHPDDVNEGGTFDLLEYTAVEVGGVTTIEFTRKLSTGDRFDKDIPTEGEVKLIWATSDEDEFSIYHGRRGTATVDMGTGDTESFELPGYWFVHAVLMGLATILFVLTWFTVVYKRRLKKRFLDVHHWTGTFGFIFSVVGLVIGFYMVAELDQGHFRIIHAWLGGLTIAFGLLVVALGSVFMTKKELKRKTRKPHIYMGGIAIILMVITALAGLTYAFP